MGTLFVVSTPIGNLDDITKRALNILSQVDYTICEDTRRSGQMLSYYSIKTRLLSYYEQNELERIPTVIADLEAGKNVALITDSGTPTISDPGFKLVRACKKRRISVVAIPGPSACLTAIVSSGLPTDSFFFVGYLPKKKGHRATKINQLKEISQIVAVTFCLFVPPHDLLETLENLKAIFGDIEIVLTRELTKIHEEIQSKTINEWLSYLAKKPPKGEFTLLFHPSDTNEMNLN